MFSPLDQTPPDDAPLALSPTESIPMSPELANIKASQVAWGFDQLHDTAYTDLVSGNEDALRSSLASSETVNQTESIANTIRKNPWAMTPEVLSSLVKPQDPRNIIEKKYAEKSINSLTDYNDSSLDEPSGDIAAVAKTDPAGIASDLTVSKEVMAKRTLIQNTLSEMEDAQQNQSWGGWAIDQAKSLSGLYPELKLRGQVPGTGMLEGGLLGENLEAQRRALWDMPLDQFTSTYVPLIQKLKSDNPGLALQFAQAMYGQSLSERTMANLWTPMAASDIKAVGGIALGVGKLIGRSITRSAVKDILTRGAEAAPLDAVPATVAIPEAAGHIVDAGLQQTVNRIIDQEATRITPERTAMEGIMDLSRIDKGLAVADPAAVEARIAEMEKTISLGSVLKDPQDISDLALVKQQLEEYKNQNSFIVSNGGFAREVFSRLSEFYDNSTADFIKARLAVQQTLRIGDALANKEVLKKVWDYTKGMTQGLSDNVINQTVPRLNRFTGVHEVGTIFGRNSAELFSDMSEALKTIEHSGLRVSMIDGQPFGDVAKGTSGVSIGNIGGKYYGMISRPIREIEHFIRDAVVETPESKNSNRGFFNSLGLPTWLRTPEDVLPELENMNRKIAIYAPQVLRSVLEKHISGTVDLARRRLRFGDIKNTFSNYGKGSQFQRMLDDLQRARDPITGKPGKSLDGPQDVYAYYMTNFGRAPDAIEYDAYFAAKQGMAMDYSFRNMSILKSMGRLGMEEHRISIIGKDGKEYSDWVVAAHRQPLPDEAAAKVDALDPRLNRKIDDQGLGITFKEMKVGDKTYTVAKGAGSAKETHFNIPSDSSIAYFGEHPGEEQIKRFDNFSKTKLGREVMGKVSTGEYKLLEHYNPELNTLEGFSNIGADRIQYSISKNVETRPLSFQQLPRQPGFHLEYDHPWYLKQPKVRKSVLDGHEYNWYEGDSTAFLLENRLMGQDLGKIMNEVRTHIFNGREAEAEAAAKALPVGYKEMRGWFAESRGPGGKVVPARFNLNEDFKVVPKGKMSIELSGPTIKDKYKGRNFRDGTKVGSPARQFQVEFTGERDAYDVMQMSNAGTRFDPAYKYDPAQPLDPITSMNRALLRVTNSMFMDDVKISSMENWLKRNAGDLNVEGLGELMSAPFYHFNEAKLRSGVDKTVAARVEAERWMIKQFNGVPNFIDTTLAAMQDKMMDSIYGTSKLDWKHSAAVVGKWGVTAMKDGPAFMRYMAFKSGLGMFSLPQFFVQANTFVTIAGVSGWGKAGQGGAAALMHQWSRFNKHPNILRTADRKLAAFGWKPGEWLEANELIKGSGFDYVAGETNSMMGYTKTDGLFKATGRTFLDMGDIPFKEGERFGRYGAWYTAFKEFRDANPIGRLTEVDKAKILNRADMLAGNMTRASKSGLQSGVLSFPTQFLGYSMRLTEMALGQRLTWQEKSRLFGTYWAAYGLPVAFGITGVTGFGDMWKDSVTKNGYNPNELSVAQMVNEGLPSAFLKLVTGNTYNVGERYGNPGLDVIRNFMSTDKTVLETFAGASGSMAFGALQGMDGYWKWLGSFFRGDDKQYGMISDDFIQPFKTLASINNAWRTEMAVNTGVWMSKNETPLKDNVGTMNAIFMSTTGLQPMDVDTQTLTRMTEERAKMQKEGLNSFIKNVHRGMDAVKNKDPQMANVFFNNAKTVLALVGYPEERRSQAWNAALQGRTLPERELWNYWIENVDPEQRVQSAEIYSNAMRNLKP